MYACVAVTCHQHFGQNDQDLLHAAAVIQGGIDIKVRVSTASWPQRRKFTHHTCRDSNLQPFNRESSALPLSYPCSTFFYTTSKFNLPNHKQSTEPQLWTQKRCNQVRNSNNKHISIVTFHLTTTTWSIISIPSMNPKLYALCGINWGEKIYGITNICLFSVTVHNLKCFGTKLYSAGTQHGNLYPSVVICRVSHFILQALNMETCISLL